MDTEAARMFLEVLDQGSLTSAARRLFLTKTALRRRIDALETSVGAKLLERGSMGVSPTTAGEVFAARIRSVLVDFDAAVEASRRAEHDVRRRVVRVACYSDYLFPFPQLCMEHFARMHPDDLVVPVFIGFSQAYDAVRDGTADVAICPRLSARATKGVGLTPLYVTRMVAMVCRSNPLASMPALSHADLAGREVVVNNVWCAKEELDSWCVAREPHVSLTLSKGGLDVMQSTCSRGGVYLYPQTEDGLLPFVSVELQHPLFSCASIIYPPTPSAVVRDYVSCTLDFVNPYVDPDSLLINASWDEWVFNEGTETV